MGQLSDRMPGRDHEEEVEPDYGVCNPVKVKLAEEEREAAKRARLEDED